MNRQTDALSINSPALVHACGFSYWKRPIVRQFFADAHVVFVRSTWRVPPHSTLVVWGRKPIPGKMRNDLRIVRLEDGFLRSVGLGADLIRPLSWVKDTRGIYYDATQPSDLEVLLQTSEFTVELLARAARLRERIVGAGLTKYNVGSGCWQRPGGSKRVILVPGQVESDASLRFGAPTLRSNLALLQAVRKANPDAYVLYKPHPDVLAGLRVRGQGEDEAAAWCDEIVTDVAMGGLLHLVDEVHVLTSLAGFEALLRGKSVTCYGLPFYAGWGLTHDMCPVPPRRIRRLSLEELIAGALILYPVYIDRTTGKFITPERAVDDLLAWRKQASFAVTWWRRGMRWVLRWAAS